MPVLAAEGGRRCRARRAGVVSALTLPRHALDCGACGSSSDPFGRSLGCLRRSHHGAAEAPPSTKPMYHDLPASPIAAPSEDLGAHGRLLEQYPDPLHCLDEGGRVVSCNRAWLELTGFEAVDVLGRPLDAFLAQAPYLTEELLTRACAAEVVLYLACRDGTRREVLAAARRPWPEGAQPGVLLMRLRDSSAVTRMKEMAAHQDKLASVGMLAAGVAHEINNPIGFVASMLNTLDKYLVRLARLTTSYRALEELVAARAPGTEGPAGERAVAECLAQIRAERQAGKIDFVLQSLPELVGRCREGTERVKRIVSDLRTFARVDDASAVAVDLNQIVESALNICWNELKYKAEVVRDLAELPPVRANASKLSQVFINLFVNAAQSIEGKGTVTIRSRRVADGTLQVAVTDTGCGIAPEHLPRLFDPFFTTKPPGQGTGLGLNVASNIVQHHGGRIRVETGLGRGSTFFVELPCDAEGCHVGQSAAQLGSAVAS
ncbi:MAG: PAS domain-containing protein [Myxococcales bacterium]|nr:PAS domain-containing protein [Myxococcales bacterium]